MSNNSNNNSGVMTQKGREALDRFKMESASELGVKEAVPALARLHS